MGEQRTTDRGIGALVGFAQRALGAQTEADVVAALVDAVAAGTGASGAVGYLHSEAGGPTRVAASPPELLAGVPRGDGAGGGGGAGLADGLRALAPERFAAAATFPLSSGGVVRGALVVGSREPAGLAAADAWLVEALLALAAPALANVAERARLARDAAQARDDRAAHARRESLAVLAQFASLVAHEVRNPLASIGGALQVIRSKLAGRDGEVRVIGSILERLDALDRMITELLLFARPRAPQFEDVDLRAVAEAARQALAADPAWAAVAFGVRGRAPLVRGDREQLDQVLRSLLVNAAQANGGAGEVAIEVGVDGGHACVRVSDRGPGVDEGVRGSLFEPFVTTRAKAAGLGLAVARRLTEGLGGEIRFACPDDGGSVFTVRLPLLAAPG
jgi:signal transduction histidine kinase